MPRQVFFKNHPETSGESFAYNRLFRPIIATDLLYEKMQERNRDYFTEYAQELNLRKQQHLEALVGGKQPLIHWMNTIMDEIERRVDESFSWTFERHSAIHWCDEESENVFVCSVPYWIVTILDFEGSLVHKNWSIAFSEDYADFLTHRGQLSEKNWLSTVDWKTRKKRISQLIDAIKSFQRMRNFRLA